MSETQLNQWPITKIGLDDLIHPWMESFLIDRKVQNMSTGTLYFYRTKLQLFSTFCETQAISYIHQVTPDLIRKYLVYLEDMGHNAGGIHAAYRALKTFLYWWEAETEPEGWRNPIRKVKAPKVAVEALQPVELSAVERLIATCKGTGFNAIRDRALFLFLLDTGARAAEVCSINLDDIDLMAGAVLIQHGKGRKPRTVFLGQKTRRAVRTYLKQRTFEGELTPNAALWVTDEGTRISYWGVNEILRRRAVQAKVEKPGLHDFRRAFALNFLRNGSDIYALQKLMGHADLQVLRRYLAQTTDDLQRAHNKYSPVDNSGLRG